MFRTGDIVNQHTFWKPTLIQTAQVIIRHLTSSYYDHTGIILVENGITYVVEAQFDSGIVKVKFEDWINDTEKVVCVYRRKKPVHDPIIASVIKSHIDKKRYDYLALFQQAWYQIRRRLKQNVDYNGYTKNGKATDRFYCSEFAAYCHDLDDWWKFVPGDFEKSEEFEKITIMHSR